MRWFVSLSMLAVLFLLENFFGVFFGSDTPPLVLIGVIYYAALDGPREGIVVGAVAGLFAEFFWQGPMGYQILYFCFVGALSGAIAKKIFRESFLVRYFLPVLALYFYFVWNYWISSQVIAEDLPVNIFTDAFKPSQSIATIAAGPLVFWFLRKFSKSRRKTPYLYR